jgi:AAA+ ATPase superfamily predicted ATPase
MKTADELTIDALQKECQRLRAELRAVRKDRDWWKIKRELAIIAGNELADKLQALRAEREAERRAEIRAMDRDLSS